MKRKLSWQSLLPLGMDPRKIRKDLLLAWGVGVGWSTRFLIRYAGARGELFEWNGRSKVLREGARMLPFDELLGGSFILLVTAMLLSILLAWGFYAWHYQDSRSIYTMKRLPNPWELWRRVLTVPAAAAAVYGLTIPVLTGLYYLIYLWLTPAACLL